MNTARTIGSIVAAILLAVGAAVVALVVIAGTQVGLLIAAAAVVAITAVYRWGLRPWHVRWGTIDAEPVSSLPR